MRKIPVIDLVRTWAFLAVIACHLGTLYLVRPSAAAFLDVLWYKLWVNGHFGVSIFFVVSGYLITRLIAESPGGLFHPRFRDFYTRRAGRILPLLGWTVLYGLLLSFFLPHDPPAFQHCFRDPTDQWTPAFWLSILCFWQNWYQIFHAIPELHWNVLWSLSVEEQFYLFYPLALSLLGSMERLVAFLSFLVLLGPFSRGLFYEAFHRSSFTPVQFNSFSGFGLIATGCLLYLAEGPFRERWGKDRKRCLLLALAGFLIVLWIYFKTFVFSDYWGRVFDNSILGLGVFLFLLGAFHLESFGSRTLEVLSRPGKLSYGMYLYHATLLYFLWDLFPRLGPFTAFFLFVLATYAVAWTSYHYYEWPANLWIRRILSPGSSAPRGK